MNNVHPLFQDILKPFAPKTFCPCGRETFKVDYCELCLDKPATTEFVPSEQIGWFEYLDRYFEGRDK